MIHYFLEGELGFNYTESWHKYAGHLPIVKWDIKSLPIDKYPQLNWLVEQRKYSMLSDFTRWWAVLEHGGIYLDYDVELVKPIDDLLELESFVCIEGHPVYPNGAVSGGKKGNQYHAEILERYFEVIDGRKVYPSAIEVACSPWMLKDYVQYKKGGQLDDSDLYQIKTYGGFTTLPKEYFYPYNWNEQYSEKCITPNTRGIHWWKHSWK
jgi:mannosyltransferase OCH1-like enzyme